jgi:hypothetical protein
MTKPPETAGLHRQDGDPFANATMAAQTVVNVRGRHNVGIFPGSQETIGIAAIIILTVGLPLFLFLAILPIWESWGDLLPVIWLNSHIAPAVNNIPDHYRAAALPRLPLRRLLIAATSMVELLFLSNFLAMPSRRARKRALMAWLCIDKRLLLTLLLISNAALVAVWCFLFYNWTILDFIGSERSGSRIVMLAVAMLPLIALLSGRLTTIVVVGILRSMTKQVRRWLDRIFT